MRPPWLPTKQQLAATGARALHRPALLAARLAWYVSQGCGALLAGVTLGLATWLLLYASLVPRTIYRWPIVFTETTEASSEGPWAGEIVPLRRAAPSSSGVAAAPPVTVQVFQTAGDAEVLPRGAYTSDVDDGSYILRSSSESSNTWQPSGPPVGHASLSFDSEAYARARAGAAAGAGFSRFSGSSGEALPLYGEDVVLGYKTRDEWEARDIAAWAAALARGDGGGGGSDRPPAGPKRRFSLSRALQSLWSSLTSTVHPPPPGSSARAQPRAWAWAWGVGVPSTSSSSSRGASSRAAGGAPAFMSDHEYDASLILAFPDSPANAKVPRVLVKAQLMGAEGASACTRSGEGAAAVCPTEAPVLTTCSRLVNLDRLAATAAQRAEGAELYGADGRRLSGGRKGHHHRKPRRRGLARRALDAAGSVVTSVFDVVLFVPRALARLVLPSAAPHLELEDEDSHGYHYGPDAPVGSIARVECFNGFTPSEDDGGMPVALRVMLRGPREAAAVTADDGKQEEGRWVHHHPEVLGGYFEVRMRLWGLPRAIHDHAWLLGSLFVAAAGLSTLLCCAGLVAAVRWKAGWGVGFWIPAPSFLTPAATKTAAAGSREEDNSGGLYKPPVTGSSFRGELLPDGPDLGPADDEDGSASFDNGAGVFPPGSLHSNSRSAIDTSSSDLADFSHDIFSGVDDTHTTPRVPVTAPSKGAAPGGEEAVATAGTPPTAPSL